MLWHILCINDQSSYKPKTDMNRCKSYELESSFIETINTKKANIKVSWIYRHPSMDLNKFNNIY